MVVLQFTKKIGDEMSTQLWEDVTPPGEKIKDIDLENFEKSIQEPQSIEKSEKDEDFAAVPTDKGTGIVYDEEMTPEEQAYIIEEENTHIRPGIRKENLVPVADEEMEKARRKPAGHKAFVRRTKTGKIAQVPQKGMPKLPKKEQEEEDATDAIVSVFGRVGIEPLHIAANIQGTFDIQVAQPITDEDDNWIRNKLDKHNIHVNDIFAAGGYEDDNFEKAQKLVKSNNLGKMDLADLKAYYTLLTEDLETEKRNEVLLNKLAKEIEKRDKLVETDNFEKATDTDIAEVETAKLPLTGPAGRPINWRWENAKSTALETGATHGWDSPEAKKARYNFYRMGGKKEHLSEGAQPKYGYGKKRAPVPVKTRAGKVGTRVQTVGRKERPAGESEITKDDFQAYEGVRSSGVTNMFNTKMVSMLSGLDRDKILKIMKNYGELMKQYPDVREAANFAKAKKHTPIVSEAQRRLFGAVTGGAKTIAEGLSPTEAKRHLKEAKGKKLPEKVKKQKSYGIVLRARNPLAIEKIIKAVKIETDKISKKEGEKRMKSYGVVIKSTSREAMNRIVKAIKHNIGLNKTSDCGCMNKAQDKPKGKKGMWGGRGPGFKNCVAYYIAKPGFSPKKKGDTKEDAASKLCASIGRAAGKIKSVRALKMYKSLLENKFFNVPVEYTVLNMVKALRGEKEPFGTKAKWTAKQREISKKKLGEGTPAQKEAQKKMLAGKKRAKKSMGTGAGMGGAGVVGVGMGTVNPSWSYKQQQKKVKKQVKKSISLGAGKEYISGQTAPTKKKVEAGYPQGTAKIAKHGTKGKSADRGANAASKQKVEAGYPQGISRGVLPKAANQGPEYITRTKGSKKAELERGYPKGASKGMPKAGGKAGSSAERGSNAYSEAKATAGYPKGASHGMTKKSIKIEAGKEYINRPETSLKKKLEEGYPQGPATTKR